MRVASMQDLVALGTLRWWSILQCLSTGEETTGQGRPRDDAEPFFLTQRNHFSFLFPVEEVVVILHGHEARPAVALTDAQHAHELPCIHGARPDIADFALSDQLVERFQCFLTRRIRIKAVDLVEVDGFDA